MRLGGIATGFDTQGLIQQLMEVERQPIQRKQADIGEVEGKKDEWRDVNKMLSGLSDDLSSLSNRSTFQGMEASSSDDIVSVSADNNAQEGNYDVEIDQVAKRHRLGSTEAIEEPEEGRDGNLVLEVGEHRYTVEVSEEDSLNDVVEDINNGLIEKVEKEDEDGNLEEVDKDDIPVNASVIAGSYLQLEAEEPGKENEIEISDESSGDVLDWLNLEDEFDENGENKKIWQEAEDAKVHINNELVTIEESSNQIEIAEGVEVDISDLTSEDLEDGSVHTNVSVSKDLNSAREDVESFEESYNEIIGGLEEKTDVTVIDDEASDEESVESGALQGDTTINNIMRNMRTNVTEPVDVSAKDITIDGEEVDSLVPAQFGIEVGASMADGGFTGADASEISIDYDKLEEQMRNNPEAVEELFSGDDGIATRLDEYLDGVVYDSEPTAGQSHNRDHSVIENRLISKMGEVDRIEDRIESRERRMDQREDRLWSEFTRMEEGIMNLQAESQGMMQGMGDMMM
ncbi:flagellar filament capping protein FliD [Natranaerobius trueperi]|uniref:Flagellar hook-associated protein 2 n=1 Tax=Natranaerobius trueperi TaxID=759412 RepID=A0A226C0M2_9FIRM|nr:flagellar filament capping protein FliD [Natranaerobius trueperi]OWZ84848.1 hypothetical protein CDO51_00115 [Natranaerobius trueperi]